MRDLYIITGAAGGMGADAARSFHECGDLLLLDVSEKALKDLTDELGTGVDYLTFDITKEEDIQKLAQYVSQRGGFKGLLHFAGVSENFPNHRKILDINLTGTIRLLDALYEYAGPGSVVVNASSMTAHLAPQTEEILAAFADLRTGAYENVILDFANDNGSIIYGLTKLAVKMFTEKEAARWGKKGARIVSISPGAIKTPMVAYEMEHGNGETIKGLIAMTPVQRIGLPEDITALCRFLCSDSASFITGTDILIDGGATEVFRQLSAQR